MQRVVAERAARFIISVAIAERKRREAPWIHRRVRHRVDAWVHARTAFEFAARVISEGWSPSWSQNVQRARRVVFVFSSGGFDAGFIAGFASMLHPTPVQFVLTEMAAGIVGRIVSYHQAC